MKKITDERLLLRNLQHIRVAYLVQTFGILLILGYELVQGGIDGMRSNPIWLVFMVTTIVYGYLSMSTSVEHESETSNPRRSFIVSLIVVSVIAASVTVFTAFTPGFDWLNGLLVGGIIFICGLIPIFYIYRLRKKKLMELEE